MIVLLNPEGTTCNGIMSSLQDYRKYHWALAADKFALPKTATCVVPLKTNLTFVDRTALRESAELNFWNPWELSTGQPSAVAWTDSVALATAQD